MKFKGKTAIYSLSILLVVLAMHACTVDEPVTVTPKTVDQYVMEMGKFIKSEMLIVDSCKLGYNKGDFSMSAASSYVSYRANYRAALKADSAIVFKPGVTIVELANAHTALSATVAPATSSPGKLFWSKINICDKRALNDSINAATVLNNSVVAGNLGGQVLTDAKSSFTSAIASATAILTASTPLDLLVQTTVDNLTKAKANFRAAIIPTAFAAYSARSGQYVNDQLSIVQKCAVGYNTGEYNLTVKTNYENALLAAKAKIDTTSIYTVVSTALTSLFQTRSAFVPFVSDRRALNDSITQAETFNAGVLVGTTTGKVSQVAKTNFTTAITTAKTTRDTPTSTDGTVKASAYTLYNAKKTFMAAIVK